MDHAPLASRLTRMPLALDEGAGRAASAALPQGPFRDLGTGAAGSSPYLAGLLRREGEWAAEALAGAPEAALAQILAEAAAIQGAPDLPLRILKRRMHLLVALADLGGAWDLAEVTGALTAFADAALAAALAHAAGREAARGRPATGLVVLAMGKMGAGELNYSSDIDLIALFDQSLSPPEDYAETRAACIRATRAIARILGEVGPEGYVLRTDLRLRPDPSVTPVCLPMDAAERYYESLGRGWERAAHIKARAAAGDVAAGEAYLARLAPFVWRRHLDFAAIEDTYAMTRRIRDHKGLAGPIEVPGHDLKLGRGGIRAIEFTAQTGQLIFGGRDPALRARGTVEALARLDAAGRLPPGTAGPLAEDYAALRAAEHRIQMLHDAQTHAVPQRGEGLDRLARLHGESDTTRFIAALRERLERVHALTEAFLAPSEPQAAPPPRREAVERWSSFPALRSARARAAFERIAGPLVARLEATARPEQALAAFEGFLAGLPAGVQIFALFESNPALMDLLADICGAAPGLARHLGREAGVLDAVIAGEFFSPWPGTAALAAQLAAAMAGKDYEAQLDAMRLHQREWHFRIGVHHLRGLIDAAEAGAQYASLAEAVVAALLPAVEADLAARHGPAPGRGACVLAMGSLGAGLLHAASDLDLIVIYDAAGQVASEGRRPLAARAWYARLTQALVTALSAPMARGKLYDVDMRLRPSGRQGPVATSLEAFRAYQSEEAWIWEHLALTRARPVAGPADLRTEIEAFRRALIAAPPAPPALAEALADMRGRLKEAHPRRGDWDMRAGPGGLRDVEMLGQARALAARSPVRAAPEQIGLGPALEAWALMRPVHVALRLVAAEGAPEGGEIDLARRESGAADAASLLARVNAARAAASAEIDAQIAAWSAQA